ncbi:MAG: hypothetical protein H0T71_08580 [Acidobacteria bacterium]|nr:hypothetical protein [Acidobacteriota bacterium]
MTRDLFTSLLVIGVMQAALPTAPRTPASQSPQNRSSTNQTPTNQAPDPQRPPEPPAGNVSDDNASPLKPSAPDPAAIVFGTELGLVLVAVKPDKVADYENALVALQEVLAAAADSETRELARSWRVFKAVEVDAKSNPLYVHVLQSPVAGADYRPSLWLDKLLAGAPAELLAKYRDAFAVAPSKLALAEFANMAVAPLPKPTNESPASPATNASPNAPVRNASPATPGNTSPVGATWWR